MGDKEDEFKIARETYRNHAWLNVHAVYIDCLVPLRGKVRAGNVIFSILIRHLLS